MFNINDIIRKQSKSYESKKEVETKDSAITKPIVRYSIRHEYADFFNYDTREKLEKIKGRLTAIKHCVRKSDESNFYFHEFQIELSDDSGEGTIQVYGKDGSIATQDMINRCLSIKSPEELDIEISFFVRAVSIEVEYVNGFVRKTIDNKPLEPFKQFKELPKDAAARIEYYKNEIEKLNARIRDWN
jgi:hypothetical protein